MAVLISKYSHDQLASYISSVNRWVSSCVASCHLIGPHKEGDIPIMTLIPLSSSSCHLTTLAKFLKSSCSWFHHFKVVMYGRTCNPFFCPGYKHFILSVNFSILHIVCTTLHLTLPHPPACPTYRRASTVPVISILILFENLNLGC